MAGSKGIQKDTPARGSEEVVILVKSKERAVVIDCFFFNDESLV
ncbi:MAG: hypothetical protein RJA38_512 [Bacteroidota bacterium]|jgi:hypothetical protein